MTRAVDSISCVTAAHAEGDVTLVVKTSAGTEASTTFSYSLAATPTVTGIVPAAGNTGDTITITGKGLNVIHLNIGLLL